MARTKKPIPPRCDWTRCDWTPVEESYDSYETDCGHTFEFNEGDVAANHFTFCPFCGKRTRGPDPNGQFWCIHKGGLGPPFPYCEICSKAVRV